MPYASNESLLTRTIQESPIAIYPSLAANDRLEQAAMLAGVARNQVAGGSNCYL